MLSLYDQKFETFKGNFYRVFAHPEHLNCSDFNLLKVVLDGLKTNYVSKNWYADFIFKPLPIQRVLLFLKNIKSGAGKPVRTNNEPFLFFDNGRTASDEEGKPVSFYFHRLKGVLGGERCFTLLQGHKKHDSGSQRNYADLASCYTNLPYNEEEKALVLELKAAYNKIKDTNNLEDVDLRNIATAFNAFFFQFRVFARFFDENRFTHCFFDQHYHREGMILALRRRKIKAIELQHGIILPQDIFYVFPESVRAVAKRALFPDKILTYAEYWSDVLRSGYEFREDQIDVIGQYQNVNTHASDDQIKELVAFTKENPFVLVTTQTFLHENFVSYIQWLASDLTKRGADTKIIVKLHPAEKKSSYTALDEIDRVKIMDVNTEFLLSRCAYHISVYSTTLYDASKYTCRNFSLNLERCKDYVDELVRSGVSELLELNENPLDKKVSLRNKIRFYEDFNLHKHKLQEL